MTDQNEPLDDDLRRLFADARLDVSPREGASEAVVAGARRIRRRRAAMAGGGGALAVVALIAGGLTFGGLHNTGDQQDLPIAAPNSTEQSPSAPGESPPGSESGEPQTPPPSQAQSQTDEPPSDTDVPSAPETPPSSTAPSGSVYATGPVFGPDGYEQLKLGMSYDDAVATGMLSGQGVPPPAGSCSTYQLAEGTSAIRDVSISGSDGVVGFRAGTAQTTNGIAAGATLDQLRASYPGLVASGSGYTAAAGGAAQYHFTVAGDTVTEVQLLAQGAAC
ncbi:hypothetical protein ABZ639_14620 [Saccharomonospora sp. NPDC006951]